MSDLRKAAKDLLHEYDSGIFDDDHDLIHAVNALRAALAAPRPEPVTDGGSTAPVGGRCAPTCYGQEQGVGFYPRHRTRAQHQRRQGMSDKDNITLPREVAEHLTKMLEEIPLDLSERDCAALTALRTALAAPQPEPFVIKHYTADLRPTIKGNGFDGLEIGISREEAEEFVAWVNARIAAPPAAAPKPEPGLPSGYVDQQITAT
jgi:hypothetical protein